MLLLFAHHSSLAVEELMESLKKVLNSPRRRPVYLAVRSVNTPTVLNNSQSRDCSYIIIARCIITAEPLATLCNEMYKMLQFYVSLNVTH